MIHPDELAQAIEMTGSRYALCILLAKRVRQIRWHQRRPGIGFGAYARQALDDVINRKIDFFLSAAEAQTAKLLAAKNSELIDYALLSLFALSRANLENDGTVYVGREYSIEAGISATADESFTANPFDIKVSRHLDRIPFDFLIHLIGDLKLIGDCQRRLDYDPWKTDPQLIEFMFDVLDEGSNLVSVDCYHDRRWLRTFEFNFKSIRMKMKAVA